MQTRSLRIGKKFIVIISVLVIAVMANAI
uniref:Uncharacterized protein n=1 Tax=Acrobeloides nanus TaxID=290746 RepID=A0A914DAF9_9BILA